MTNLTTLTPGAARVLDALRAHIEHNERGEEWGTVYLDNAKPADMSVKSFRSFLASLSQAGLYRVVDGYAWGSVKAAN